MAKTKNCLRNAFYFVANQLILHDSMPLFSEGVPEERRILNKVEDSRSYLTDHAVQALLPALPLRQGRQVWPPSRQAEMVVPALRISVHQPVSRGRGQKPRQSFICNRYRCSGRVADWLGSLGYSSFLKDS